MQHIGSQHAALTPRMTPGEWAAGAGRGGERSITNARLQ